jgi:membrane associated rhomboid family serine protease
MPFLPVHSDQEISHIAAPYLTWGAILVCVAAHVAISTAPTREAAGIMHQFGFIAGTLFGNLPQQALPFALPETATLLTYAFLHGSNAHLIGNMVVLFVFGGAVEDRFRHAGFAFVYFGAAIVGALAEGMAAPGSSRVLIGASGAVAGVLGAYIVLFPKAEIAVLLPIFLSVRVPAWGLIGAWFAYDVAMLFYGEGNVAWLAHIGGFSVVLGAALVLRMRQRS